MEHLPSELLVSILGHFCDSPMASLALACCSKKIRAALDDSWLDLHKIWSKRWGDPGGLDSEYDKEDAQEETIVDCSPNVKRGRKLSKRLADRQYYTPHKCFVRLVEVGAINAAVCHSEIFNLTCENKVLTTSKLRSLLHTWTPVWVNCGGFKQERGQAPLLVEALRSRSMRPYSARGVAEELILRWNADKEAANGDGMRPLSVAAARGFADCVEFLLLVGCSLELPSTGSFLVKRKCIRGSYTPHGWATRMLEAEMSAGTTGRHLKGLKKCIEMVKPSECI